MADLIESADEIEIVAFNDKLRYLAWSAVDKINKIALLEDASQADVRDVFNSIRRHLDARAADAERNAKYDQFQTDLAIFGTAQIELPPPVSDELTALLGL
jgi:hypothetical protein